MIHPDRSRGQTHAAAKLRRGVLREHEGRGPCRSRLLDSYRDRSRGRTSLNAFSKRSNLGDWSHLRLNRHDPRQVPCKHRADRDDPRSLMNARIQTSGIQKNQLNQSHSNESIPGWPAGTDQGARMNSDCGERVSGPSGVDSATARGARGGGRQSPGGWGGADRAGARRP